MGCCDENSSILPIGPKGDKGNSGTNGTNGTDGVDGINGTNGNDGTNAFKFIKEFTTIAPEQSLTISHAEKISCMNIPFGCLFDDIDPNSFVDQVVQVWLFIQGAGPDYWVLLTQNGLNVFDHDYSLQVDAATGLMTITTGNNQGTYRVVIIG